MNILLISHTLGFGGVERHVLSLGTGLRRRGHEVVMALQRGSWLAERCDRAGIPWQHVKFRGLGDPISHVGIARLVARHEIQIVHGHARRSGFYGAIAGRIANRPTVCTAHMLNAWKQFDLNDRVIAVSHAMREYLLDKGLPGERIVVVHNGGPAPSSEVLRARDAMRARLEIEPSRLAVGMLGRIMINKRHDLLIEALHRLGPEHEHVHAYIAGEPTGRWYETLRSRIAEHRLDHRVHFVGYIEEAPEFLTALDVFVFPSSMEAQGIALLEAMSVGLPSVCTHVGGIPEMIEDEQSGLLFPRGDAEAFTRKLRRLLLDPGLRQRLGEKARQICTSEFSEDSMIRKTEVLYESLLVPAAP